MIARHHDRIRTFLRGCADGMTAGDISSVTGIDIEAVRRSLKSMPDVYIDRWVTSKFPPQAVWCAVHVPEDCPRPEKARTK